MYIRECPKCGKKIYHKNKYSRNLMKKQNRTCKSCSMRTMSIEYYKNLYRKCPKCKSIVYYNFMDDKIKAEKANGRCKKCMVNNGKYKKGQETANKKSFYLCWIEKYGKEEADKRLKDFRLKQSKNSKGNKNRMFGKSSPVGLGNGWSGWYKGWYFRSLLELSYMIKVIERFNINWINAECKNFSIPYLIDNKKRTYRADFLLNNKYLIDCKPKKLWYTKENKLKYEAAKNFCDNNGLIFKFVEIPKLDEGEILSLYENKQIKFLDRYEQKMKINKTVKL